LRSARGFSLVEVVLAIGVTAYAGFAIAGLIPLGMSSFRQTKNISTASLISRQIFSELQATPFAVIIEPANGEQTPWRLPPPGRSSNVTSGATNNVRFFDEQGDELAATTGATTSSGVPAGTIYEVNVGVRYAPFVQAPGAAAPAVSPGYNPALVIVTIQVAFNPGHLALDMSSTNPSLWAGTVNSGATPSVQIFTYQTIVAGDPTPNI
jgi:uncharacterized protein (TIGR02598 family)